MAKRTATSSSPKFCPGSDTRLWRGIFSAQPTRGGLCPPAQIARLLSSAPGMVTCVCVCLCVRVLWVRFLLSLSSWVGKGFTILKSRSPPPYRWPVYGIQHRDGRAGKARKLGDRTRDRTIDWMVCRGCEPCPFCCLLLFLCFKPPVASSHSTSGVVVRAFAEGVMCSDWGVMCLLGVMCSVGELLALLHPMLPSL